MRERGFWVRDSDKKAFTTENTESTEKCGEMDAAVMEFHANAR
jgi:hypothetical protein